MKQFLPLLLILFVLGCKQDAKNASEDTATDVESADLNVQLVCEDIGSTDERPHFGVYLIVNNSKTKIKEIAVACEALDAGNFVNYEIPTEALAAVGGWWAGAGDYFYARKIGEKVIVYYAGVDEAMAEPGYPYEVIATYENGKFSVEIPEMEAE